MRENAESAQIISDFWVFNKTIEVLNSFFLFLKKKNGLMNSIKLREVGVRHLTMPPARY